MCTTQHEILIGKVYFLNFTYYFLLAGKRKILTRCYHKIQHKRLENEIEKKWYLYGLW